MTNNYTDENWTPTSESVAQLIRDFKKNDIEYQYSFVKNIDIGNGWRVSCAERFGGREGAGEEHWIVLKIEKGDNISFWQIDGYYQSHYGAELDGEPYRVEEREKKVKVWVKI